MMIFIKDIFKSFEKSPGEMIGQNVTLWGRVSTYRFAASNTLCFIHLIDGSTVKHIQCVCKKEVKDSWPGLDNMNRGVTISVQGEIIKSPGSEQPIELAVDKLTFLGKIQSPKEYRYNSRGIIPRDTLRTNPSLRHHDRVFLAIQLIKQTVYKTIHETMTEMKIGEVQPTLITGNECESGAFPFTVTTQATSDKPVDFTKDFFGKQVYLTVSSQLHLEATVCGTMNDGYCMTTAFRAEPSKGPLHLAEFCMVEWEVLEKNMSRNMKVAETLLKKCFKKVLDEHIFELHYLEKYRQNELDLELKNKLAIHQLRKKEKGMKKKVWLELRDKIQRNYDRKKKEAPMVHKLQEWASVDFKVISHENCIKTMLKDCIDDKVEFNDGFGFDEDLSKEHERYVTNVIAKGIPTFVTNFPKKIKSFYMPEIEGGTVSHVMCYDLLIPGVGEVVGGSQRIHDYDILKKRMEEKKITGLDWYLELRKWGTVPHGGAGLGLGRLLMAITGIPNIKDMQEFPRSYGGNIMA